MLQKKVVAISSIHSYFLKVMVFACLMIIRFGAVGKSGEALKDVKESMKDTMKNWDPKNADLNDLVTKAKEFAENEELMEVLQKGVAKDLMDKEGLISMQIPINGQNLPIFGIGIIVGYSIILPSVIGINLIRTVNLTFLVSQVTFQLHLHD